MKNKKQSDTESKYLKKTSTRVVKYKTKKPYKGPKIM